MPYARIPKNRMAQRYLRCACFIRVCFQMEVRTDYPLLTADKTTIANFIRQILVVLSELRHGARTSKGRQPAALPGLAKTTGMQTLAKLEYARSKRASPPREAS